MRAEFTSGKILAPLMKFTVPIMIALILQALYGAVDLLVVGQFASPEAVSAVATGSQVMHSMMVIITGLAMGITVLIGQQFGRGEPEKVGQTVESGVFLFGCLALVLTGVMVAATPALVTLMQAPAEAVAFTNQYVLICSGGILFIAAYNTLGSIFRGLGDARTPLLAVAIACVANIVLDLLFVAGFNMGRRGRRWQPSSRRPSASYCRWQSSLIKACRFPFPGGGSVFMGKPSKKSSSWERRSRCRIC